MSDAKISQLTAATALAGTEVVPVVQGGTTKKATIDQILTPAAGKGIDFSANTGTAGMTSELLDWYEEGVFTPVFANLTLGNGSVAGRYTRIGRIVTATIQMEFGTTTAWTGFCSSISGLPFASPYRANGLITLYQNGVRWTAGQVMIYAGQQETSFPVDAVGNAFNATSPWTWGNGDFVIITLTYEV